MMHGIAADLFSCVRAFLSSHQDAWIRNEGGGGITRVIQDGNVWEKV
jgi:coproporphyrinogen III oxidase